MALHVPKAPGLMSMLKDGSRFYEGFEEVIYRNIQACLAFSQTTRSTYGPAGQNKIVINHIGKQFVTNDCATILKELEIEHPAAKILLMSSQQQEQEAGDGTNIALQLAAALLEEGCDLLKMGLTVPHLVNGYEIGCKKALEILKELTVDYAVDLKNFNSVRPIIKTSIMSKHYELSDFLADLITNACVYTLPQNSHFDVDNVRVLKILGSGVESSVMVKGMVFRRETEGEIKEAKDCHVAVFSCPLDSLQTETKGTVLLTSADELKQFSQGEEDLIESQMKSIANSGVKVIVSGGKVGEIALHYANKFGLMVVRLSSKFDIRRICTATGAVALPKFSAPTKEEMGYVKCVRTEEIADANIIIFEPDMHEKNIVTLVIRGSTENIMDDIERAVDDGVNTFKCLTRDPKVVAGAGATELELARRLLSFGSNYGGIEMYSLCAFARAFEIAIKALAENSGHKATDMIAALYSKHEANEIHTGLVTYSSNEVKVGDAFESKIMDTYFSKYWAIRYATNAANTILQIDQIIMSRPAGGPKPPQPGAPDDD